MLEIMLVEWCKMFKILGVELELIEGVKGMKGVIVCVEELFGEIEGVVMF